MTGKKDLTRLLVEGCVSRTLRQMTQDTRRSARYLLDLGVQFFQGPVQTSFLEAAERILDNEQGAYYTLMEAMVRKGRTEQIATFGINFGYEGLTRGTARIRRIEASDGYHIPWCLMLACSSKEPHLEALSEIIRQGTEQGIYVYFLLGSRMDLKILRSLVTQFPLCAFVLLTCGENLLSQPLETVSGCDNLYVSVPVDRGGFPATEAMRNAGMLYGVHRFYRDEGCMAPEMLDACLPYDPVTVMLLPEDSECFGVSPSLYRQVKAHRMAQQYPFFLVEGLGDGLFINDAVSGQGGLLLVKPDGSTVGLSGRGVMQGGNILKISLAQVLRQFSSKEVM